MSRAPRRRRWWLPLVAGALSLSLSLSNVAGAAPRVALVTPVNGDATTREAATRMRAELRAAGFEVIMVDARTDGDPRAQVERAAPDERPFATVLLVPAASGAAAEIWVADHLTSKTLVRRVVARGSRGARPASALAIRALELLRASLLETQPGAHTDPAAGGAVPPEVARWVEHPTHEQADQAPPVTTTPSPAPATPSTEALPASAEPATTTADEPPAYEQPQVPWAPMFDHAGVELGGGVLTSANGIGATFAPVVRVWYHLVQGLSARASFVGPALGPDLRAPAGIASIHQELGTLGAAYVFALGPRWLVPTVSLGVGALHVNARGSASPPYVGESSDVWAVVFDGGAGLGVRPFENVALLLDGHALLAAPRPVVAIASASVSAGRPALLGSLTGVVTF